MKNLCCLIILFLSFIHSFSQTLKKGYIITSSADTLKGYIQEGTDEELLKQLFFSENLSSSRMVNYKSQELNGFGFSNGRIFEKFMIKELSGKDTVSNRVLAKKIMSGKISAYMIESDKHETEWILTNNETDKIVHLTAPKDKLEKKENGETGVIKDYKYLHYLTVIKQDAQHSPIKQENIKYAKSDILNDLEKFNLQYTEHFPFHQYKEQKQIAYSYLAGYAVYNPYGLTNFFKLNIHRDVTWIEKSTNFSIVQAISYCRGNLQQNAVSAYQALTILPVGFKLQPKPMIVTPYIYTNLGLTIELIRDDDYLDQYRKQTYSKRYFNEGFLPIYLCFNSGAGAKIKLTSSCFFISELSYQLPLHGLFVNAGLTFHYLN